MKARVKATGEIVDIAEYSTIYAENYDTCFYPSELEFLDNSEDYWTRLEHQYAGMAMQGLCANSEWDDCTWETMAEDAISAAHALVEKLKNSNI